MEPVKQLEFKVLIRRDFGPSNESAYVAQCLTYDLVATGETVSDVLISLKRLIVGQILYSLNNGIEPFSDFNPAPKELWDSYDETEATEADAFDVEANIQPGDWEFKGCQPKPRKFSGKALMKLAA